jgi:hypothetical protein
MADRSSFPPNEFVGGVMRDESGVITAIQWENLSPENAHLARWEHVPVGPGHPLSDHPAEAPAASEQAGAAEAHVVAAPAAGRESDGDDSSGSEGEGAAGGGGGGGGGSERPSPGHEVVNTGPASKSTCQAQGCLTKLVSKKVSMVTNALLWSVLIPLRPFKKRSNRHTCRSCKKKVCSAHFTKAPGGMKICSECAAKGVDGPASSN